MQKIAKSFAHNFIHVWLARPLFSIMLFISYLLIIKTELLQIFCKVWMGVKINKNRQNTHSSNILLLKHFL